MASISSFFQLRSRTRRKRSKYVCSRAQRDCYFAAQLGVQVRNMKMDFNTRHLASGRAMNTNDEKL